MRRFLATAVLALLFGLLPIAAAHGQISLLDDEGHPLRLSGPARRIVGLGPHIAESLHAAGAGGALVGAVDYSDFPAAARRLPRVGSHGRIDLEAVVALKPDLVIGWSGGNSPAQIDRLRSLGLPVYMNRTARLEDVARDVERWGELAGTQRVAQTVAGTLRARIARLRADHADVVRLRVFYQIWRQPLMTVGGGQVISDVIALCGGGNVFARLEALAPVVSVEAVLAADPQVIVASGIGDERPSWLDDWRRWPTLTAVRDDNLFFIPPDLIQRHGPRLVDGAERLCAQLATARARLAKAGGQ